MFLFKLSKPVDGGFKWVGTFGNWEDLFIYRDRVYRNQLLLVERFYYEVVPIKH